MACLLHEDGHETRIKILPKSSTKIACGIVFFKHALRLLY